MDKKTEILNSAYKHFSKRGYNVSMSDIAKDVGIKTPSLYSHFTSKDEIILIVIEKNSFMEGSVRPDLHQNLRQLKRPVGG